MCIRDSSSSVYGGNKIIPFNETHSVDHPVSLYAATKKSNEMLAHSYSHLFQIPMTGLRFFTVYGPMGRPDMAPMIFADAILRGQPINVFNNGDMSRDFTYIDDAVDIVFKLMKKIPQSYTKLINDAIGVPKNRWIFPDNWYVPIERHCSDNELRELFKKNNNNI